MDGASVQEGSSVPESSASDSACAELGLRQWVKPIKEGGPPCLFQFQFFFRELLLIHPSSISTPPFPLTKKKKTPPFPVLLALFFHKYPLLYSDNISSQSIFFFFDFKHFENLIFKSKK